jgi:hypothetical protein
MLIQSETYKVQRLNRPIREFRQVSENVVADK